MKKNNLLNITVLAFSISVYSYCLRKQSKLRGIGCDIVEIKRIPVEKHYVILKILTQNEWNECKNYSLLRKQAYIAGRFAAKEAIIKAKGCFYEYNEIEILNRESGEPYCNFKDVKLSISHEKKYAIAYAQLC